jgi:hypothetical protein
VPFVQPSLDAFLGESASQLLNGRFIGTAMRKKDVERHWSVALPATLFNPQKAISSVDFSNAQGTHLQRYIGRPDRAM